MTGGAGDDDAYLLWSHKRGRWWSAGGEGYTASLGRARRFTLPEAVALAAKAIPGSASRLGALPVLPVPASAAAAMVARYREHHPNLPAEEWE